VASDKRRGGIDGFQQFRRSFQRGEALPGRIPWAEQLVVGAAKRATPSVGVASPQSGAPADEPAAGQLGYLDFAWEAAGLDECDVVDERGLLLTSD
jgi:hypothetical protein